jgi:hypothetical protein
MSWAWLSPPEVDFGGRSASKDGAEKIVWLHADPYGFLGVPFEADRAVVRRAFRRLARARHPDAGTGDEQQFEELQRAVNAALSVEAAAEVSVQPTTGSWWSFSGFVEPTRHAIRGAVVGLAFEVHDLASVPLSGAESPVGVSYGGEQLTLQISYSRSAASVPVLRAKAASALESTLLVLLCLTLIPLIAVVLGVEVYFLSDDNAFVFWMPLLGTTSLGYAALGAILAAAGKPMPVRRAFAKVRKSAGHRLALPRGRT